MTKPHGMTGKKNALKDESEKKSSYIHMRVEQERKARYVREASGQGLKLAAWILDACDEKIDRETGNQ